MDAPRPVPDYGPNTASSWWYCLYCKHAQPTEYQIVSHVRYAHFAGEDAALAAGEDYTNGTHLRVMRRRWDEWGLGVVDKFHLQVESLRGGDDFAQEVGDGVSE